MTTIPNLLEARLRPCLPKDAAVHVTAVSDPRFGDYQTNAAAPDSIDNWAFNNLNTQHLQLQGRPSPSFDADTELTPYITPVYYVYIENAHLRLMRTRMRATNSSSPNGPPADAQPPMQRSGDHRISKLIADEGIDQVQARPKAEAAWLMTS